MKAAAFVLCAGLVGALHPAALDARQTSRPQSVAAFEPSLPSLDTARWLFYLGRFGEAASMLAALRPTDPDDLAGYELRTSALNLALRRRLGDAQDKDDAFKRCGDCPKLLAEIAADTTQAQTLARARLKAHEDDQDALFYLGKVDLNYVWLRLGTLGQRAGWSEYWEARRSLDAVIKADPQHIRARVARAWIDYIVDTRVPRGLRWSLGGGNRKRAIQSIRAAADEASDFFSQAEARFSLMDMLMREKEVAEAVQVARGLSVDFPGNEDLKTFIAKHER